MKYEWAFILYYFIIINPDGKYDQIFCLETHGFREIV